MKGSALTVICLLVCVSAQNSLRTKVEQVLQNEDLLKIIKAFKSTKSEQNKDSESLLSDALRSFGKALGDQHILKVDLSEEREQQRLKLEQIE